MRQRIYRAGERVCCAVGQALANVVIVLCDNAAVPEVANWPVAALVYTHNHNDDINGARAFAQETAVRAGCDRWHWAGPSWTGN